VKRALLLPPPAHRPQLTSPSLRYNPVGKQGLAALANVITNGAKPTPLNALVLSGCGLDAESVSSLGRGILAKSELKVLDLSFNDLGGQGATTLADILAVNKCLTKLNLRSNNIGPHGGKAVAKALLKNASAGGALVDLTITDNHLGGECATRIAGSLRSAKHRMAALRSASGVHRSPLGT